MMEMTENGNSAPQPTPNDISRLFCGIVLAAIVLLAFLVRHRVWLLDAGLDPDYISWANANYFGVISQHYLYGAEQFLGGHWFFGPYPPGYPAFLALVRTTGLQDPQSMRLALAAVDASACILCYQVLRGVGLLRISALAGAALYAVLPWFLKGSTRILAEGLLPALMLLLLALMLRARRRQRASDWILVGVAGVALALVRPELTLLLPPLLAGAFILSSPRNRFRTSLLVATGFLVPWIAVATSNFYLYGQFFTANSHVFFYGLFSGLGQVPNDYGYFVSDDRAVEVLKSLGLNFHSREADAYWRHLYFEAWLQHPAHVLSTIWHRLGLIMFVPDAGVFPRLNSLYDFGVYLLAGAVIVLLFRHRYSDVVIIVAPIVAAIATLGWYYVELRYVRYASLSYVFACSVLLDALLVTLMVAVRNMPVPAALSCKTAAAAVAAISIFFFFRETIALDRNARLTVYAKTLGDKVPDQTFQPLNNWQAVVQGATVNPQDDETISVTTSRTVRGYQAMALIQNSSRYEAVTLIYEIELAGEAAYVALLQGDFAAFRWTQLLKANTVTRGHITIPIADPFVNIVLMTDPSPKAEAFRVISLRYALSCIAFPSSSLLTQSTYALFPRPRNLDMGKCT